MLIASTISPNAANTNRAAAGSDAGEQAAIAQRFEQMLWSEMLAHTGLEKALTSGGGDDASAFSRYVIEAIAKDLAEHHPLGLGSRAASSSGTDEV